MRYTVMLFHEAQPPNPPMRTISQPGGGDGRTERRAGAICSRMSKSSPTKLIVNHGFAMIFFIFKTKCDLFISV